MYKVYKCFNDEKLFIMGVATESILVELMSYLLEHHVADSVSLMVEWVPYE